ncbi:MAG: acyltransferase [Alphaproteobacteria bacterium]|nr:acyltransferase [Alphaproteobacteria bacterium]
MQHEKKFFEDIEKLRALACILVLFQHIYWLCPYQTLIDLLPRWLAIGSGGVAVFFAISGFVITFSLYDKINELSGDFLSKIVQAKDWLVTFYKKRFFRIFPVVISVIVACGLFMSLCEDNKNVFSSLCKVPFEVLFGVFNNAVDYYTETDRLYCAGLGPLWTLAVESLFYMIWPLVLILCKTNNQRAIVSLVGGISFLFVVNPCCHYHLNYDYYWTVDNLAEIFFGSFFAFIYKGGFRINCSQLGAKLTVLLGMFVVWYYPSVILDLRIFYCDVVTSCSAILTVMCCIFCEGCLNLPGCNQILKYLGSRSFSFYACQLTLANFVVWFTNTIYFPKESFSKTGFEGCQLLIFVVALFLVTEILYRLVERPSRSIVR